MSELERFEAVMRENGPRIFTLAIRLTGNEADGSDLAQDTFVRAWRAWDRFKGEAEPGTWLYRICVNTWKNRVRSEKRRFLWKHLSLGAAKDDEEGSLALDLPSNEPAAAAMIEKGDDVRLLRGAMARLEPEDRVIIVMFEMDEKPYDEIAEALGVPIGTVRSRLSRAREKLRRLFEELSR